MKISLAISGVILLVVGGFFLLRGKNVEGPGSPSETGEDGRAYVKSLELTVFKSFPVEVHAIVRGSLADVCTRVASINQRREDRIFTLDVRTMRPPGSSCAQGLTPFDETAVLNVFALPAGTYTVRAGDQSATFTLDANNIVEDNG